MLIEYSKTYLPRQIHEIIGILLIILVIIHLILNKNYMKAITRKKHTLKQKALLVVNISFLIVFCLTSLFGILSSQYILTPVNIGNLSIISYHKILAYINIILLGIHLGFNIEKMFKTDNKLIYIVDIIIILFGAYSLVQVDFYNHLIGNFGFSQSTGNVMLIIIEYLSIILMITVITKTVISFSKN